MSEEEKKTIEDCKELVQELKQHKDKDFIGRLYYKNKPVEDILSVLLNLIEKQQKEIEHWKAGMKIVERDKNNHIERLEKELDNIKEIEKSHKEENGKLRVELEQEKASNKFDKGLYGLLMKEKERNEKLQYKIDEKELIIDGMKEDRRIAIEEIREKYYISKERIMQEIKNIEKRMETATNGIEYQKLHCAQEYLRGLLWEV